MYNMYVWSPHIAEYGSTAGKVANLARGQLNSENEYPPVLVRARESGLARRVQSSRPASASRYSGWIWCFYSRDSARFPRGVHVFYSNHYTPSGHSPELIRSRVCVPMAFTAERHTYILPRVRRHRASSPQGSSSNGCYHFAGQHGPMNVRLSFPTPTIGMKWSY